MLNRFCQVSPDNQALLFLAKRIQSKDYRGSRSSQHNRYTLDEVHAILSMLNDFAPNKTKLTIRTTDLSKRARIKPEEQKYMTFCEV